ncbi:hypothetical protein [Brevundimonas sp.]|uniref:thermonuclease family protein n=1 Tax=Brevundimonas sp. TaxID=1871086 RepID=UPI002D72C28C|nr:hypothetical protein [Brevundimonas sp.]HYD28578.1 hypothetical protein [Brevundimonas sp.]
MKLSSWAVLVGGVLALAGGCHPNDVITVPPHQDIEVLDGDTLIFEGRWVRVRGIDAAELGPWAKCWSEAALGGASRTALEEMLWENGPWRLSSVTPTGDQGMVVADVLGRDGADLADSMAVHGYAAKTSGKWDWCGIKPLRNPREDDPLPRGPNTWWPANHMFDERAGD